MNKKQIFLLIGAMLAYGAVMAQSLQGNWEAELDVRQTKLPLRFELRYDGAWKGSMQSPKQAPNSFPLSDIRTTGDSVFLQLESLAIDYVGRLSSDRRAIHGTFKQGTMELPLVLAKVDERTPEQGPKRPQRVRPPYDYDTLDVTFSNGEDQSLLAGTLTRPKSAGKFAAVVLVSGSGPHDRNATTMGHESFKVLADYLTRNNIVVLRYDDRGVNESKGDFAKTTTAGFGEDALAALRFLRTQPKVDPTRVGLVGHSEGGLIAMILAGQQASGLHFIASLAGPTIPMDSLLLMQGEAVMAAEGLTMSDSARRIIKRNYEIAAGDLPARAAFEAILENMKSVRGSQELDGIDRIGAMVTPWFRYFIRIDPRTFIRKVRVPVFAAFGSKDVQVPASPNIESLKAHLDTDQKQLIKCYPNLNHLFQNAPTGGVGEYGQIEETMSPVLLSDLAQWIHAQ